MEFCPGCGKKSKTICKDCRPQKEIHVKDIVIKICADCKKYFYHNKWKSYKDLEDVVKKITRESVKEKLTSIKPILEDIPEKPGVQREIGVKIIFGDSEAIIPASIEFTYCNVCSKKQGDYFEGILQLRNIDENILNFVKRYCKKNKVFLPEEKKVKNGINLKISDKKKIHNLIPLLQKNFGGITKENAQVFSQDRQTSKVVYRVNFYYEAPDYKIGDVIKIDNKVIHIHKISKTISGIDLKTGKKTNVDAKKDYTVLEKKKTRISKVHPNIEVLDNEKYQSVPVQNKKKVKNGEKVTIVKDKGLYYLV
jgi:NMD protein affecting ribosome stability and mRNA decay